MVHYIRFLRTPQKQIINGRRYVKALATITNDLGDDYFPTDLLLRVKLISTYKAADTNAQYEFVRWKAGMRVLWIEVDASCMQDMQPWTLWVSTAKHKAAVLHDSLSLATLCDIVSCRSSVTEYSKSQDASTHVERRFELPLGNLLSIFEDTGESIARHIWDAGLAFVALLAELDESSAQEPPTPVKHLMPAQRKLQVLELGSGCGIVGIAFAQFYPRSEVFLTDLPEAMELLRINMEQATPASHSKLILSVLDWQEELPAVFQETTLDVILVSDCTYNCDSIPYLIKALSAAAHVSPDVLVLISLKKRHPSEAILYDLLDASGFIEIYHTSILLPDQGRAAIAETLENIEIMGYRYGTKVSEG